MAENNFLSGREKEVVELLLQGMSNKQIALALTISERTVDRQNLDTERTNIFKTCLSYQPAQLFKVELYIVMQDDRGAKKSVEGSLWFHNVYNYQPATGLKYAKNLCRASHLQMFRQIVRDSFKIRW
jgi:transposase